MKLRKDGTTRLYYVESAETPFFSPPPRRTLFEKSLLLLLRSRMATRSRTQLYIRHREALRSHRKKVVRPPDDKINRNLLDIRAALSDDEGMGDPRVYSIPPVWVVTVQDLKRDVMSIESKSAPPSTRPCRRPSP